LIFIMANVFLGFTLTAVGEKNDNPKYRYLNERTTRLVIQSDVERLTEQIRVEGGTDAADSSLDVSIGTVQRQIDANNAARDQLLAAREKQLAEAVALVKKIDELKIEIRNFASSTTMYRDTIAAVSRKYIGLLDEYQDVVRVFES